MGGKREACRGSWFSQGHRERPSYDQTSFTDPMVTWKRQWASVLTGSVTLLQKMASRKRAVTGGAR